jgi:hypothetical protein
MECHSSVAISGDWTEIKTCECSASRLLNGEELVNIVPNDSRGKAIPTMAAEGLNTI